jgi:hypothetical protein
MAEGGSGARGTAKSGLAIALLLLLGFELLLFLSGALAASPGVGLAEPDLAIVREWLAGSELSQTTAGPGHFAKPGYLLVLRLALPSGGAADAEVRRLLVLQSLWVWFGIAIAATALWQKGRPGAALSLSALSLLCVSLRDVNDWIAPESLAVGFAFVFAAALVAASEASRAAAALLGASCALFALIRPNVGAALLLVAIVLFASAGRNAGRRAASAILAFVLMTGLLALIAKATGLPVDPRAMSASTPLLFGTMDYAWPPDAAFWPPGATPEERARLEREQARDRWTGFVRRFGPDEARFLAWRLSHPILSAEQFPSRWANPLYASASRSLHRWWWIAGILLGSAAAACAGASRSAWRFVPALLVLILAAQGLLFGAETRYALPFWPLLIVGLLLACPDVRVRRRTGILAAGTTLLLAAVLLWKVPDAAASEYAVVRREQVLRQEVPRSRFRGSEGRVVHLRMLAAPRSVGFEIGDGRSVLARRVPGESAPYPAYVTFAISGEPLKTARRSGLHLQVRCLGDPAGGGFLYFPVVPGLFGRAATIDGDPRLPSGFGGITRGGFPVWTHAVNPGGR